MVPVVVRSYIVAVLQDLAVAVRLHYTIHVAAVPHWHQFAVHGDRKPEKEVYKMSSNMKVTEERGNEVPVRVFAIALLYPAVYNTRTSNTHPFPNLDVLY